MARIVFYVYPAVSHCNSTFALAKRLHEKGHEVVYSGVEELRQSVTAQGYEFLPAELTSSGNPLRGRREKRFGKIDRLRQFGERRILANVATQRISRCAAFDPLVAQANADAFLIDAHYSGETLSLIKHRVPFGIFSTKVCLDRQPGIPPICSGLIPKRGLWSAVRIWLAWQRVFAARSCSRILFASRLDVRKVFSDAARSGGFSISDISFDRSHGIGLRRAPEFLLAPGEFDFPRRLAPNQHRIGPYVDLAREEGGIDAAFPAQMHIFKSDRVKGRPLVYCSLGTLPWQYRNTDQFIGRLFNSARNAPWNLILALGSELAPFWRTQRLPNVAVFNRVPQIEVLRDCDLMITHGGMNSIKECILLGVPLIVLPGTHDMDQNGNAARVIYHGIGCRSEMRSCTANEIGAYIATMLNDPSYRRRITTMGNLVRASNAYRDGPEILANVLLTQGD